MFPMPRFVVYWKFTAAFLAEHADPEFPREIRRGTVYIATIAEDAQRAFEAQGHAHREFVGVRSYAEDEEMIADRAQQELAELGLV